MKFKSKYSPNEEITEGQYLAEIICERRAKDCGRDLPIKFWKLPEWSKYYKYQLIVAYGLLKTYKIDIIIKALNDKRTKTVFSLNNKFLVNVIKEYEQKNR